MSNLASYIFSTYSTILSLSKEELLQVGYNTNDASPIPSFDQELLISLCSEAQTKFSEEDIVLELDGDVVVVGDIHGSLHDLLRILNFIDVNMYKVLFLGDYVDRGNFSLECITLLFSLKILYPDKFYLLRGNHEFDSVCSQYGFKKEIISYYIPKGAPKSSSLPKFQKYQEIKSERKAEEENPSNDSLPSDNSIEAFFATRSNLKRYKYTETLYKAFMDAFSYLPICAIINNTSICIHGGISPLLTNVDKIKNSIQRPITNFDDNELLCDMLWSDPSKKSSDISQLFDENPRGRGKLFTGIAVSDFLKNNFLKRLIRGHECVNRGTEVKFNEKCITVFSASSYNKDMGNKSGILIVLKNGDKFESEKFSPIAQLNRSEANFFKVEPYYERFAAKGPSKPFFTMTTIRQPPVNGECMVNLNKAQSEQLFQKKRENILRESANLNFSNESLTGAENCSAGRLLKNPNGCPIVGHNRKPKLLITNVRKLNSSFAFNTGIQKKRKNSVSAIGHLPKGLHLPKPAEVQSDDQALLEVESMGCVEDDQDEQKPKQQLATNKNITLPKTLPKLVAKQEV